MTLSNQSPARAEGSIPISGPANFSALSGPEDLRSYFPGFLRSDDAGHLFAGTDLATREFFFFGPPGGLIVPHPVIQRVGANGWRREREMNITFPGGPPQYAARWSPSDPFTSLPAEQAFPALFLTAMETDPAGNCYAVCHAHEINLEKTSFSVGRHIVVIKFSPILSWPPHATFPA